MKQNKSLKNLITKLLGEPRYYLFFEEPEGGNNPPQGKQNPPAKTFTEEEVLRRVEDARKEEKSKLYEEMNGLRARIDNLTTEKATSAEGLSNLQKERDELQAQYDTLKNQHDALVNSQGDKGVDVEKLMKEVAEHAQKASEAGLSKKQAQMEQDLERLKAENQTMRLNQLRDQLIKEAGDKVIHALIRGNTEEELRKSVQEAKDAYQSVVVREKGNMPAGDNTPPTVPPPLPTGGGPTPIPADGSLPKGKLSKEEYAAQREKLLSQVRSRYPSQR